MRAILWAMAAMIPGCAAEPTGAFLAADVASVVVFGRGIGDIGVSAITGRDCSVVRLDRGLTYCAPRDLPPTRGPFCTRSLGVVDCWADPAALPAPQQEVADGPAPTDAQDRYRRARWPKSLAN
ncbi:MAG: hypothetical protein H7Z10_10540 [Gemmatimonadaceae bacterium]|nr:hypothetical protein [Acetobacteraceae bacterium]